MGKHFRFARAAAREQPKADWEQQVQNAEWRHLHAEKGSLVAYLNQNEQLHKDKFSDKSDGSELSEEETEKVQNDELDKRKAWGSLQIPTIEAAMASLQKNKAKQDKTANQLTQLMEDFFCTTDD
jgi:sortase (surface protein transpeptidase)